MRPSGDRLAPASLLLLLIVGPRLTGIDQGSSCTFRVQDLDRTADYLRSTGMGVIGKPSEGRIAIDPSGIQGAMYLFTDRGIPNDPRGN